MTATTTRKPRRAHGGAGRPLAAKDNEPQSLGRRARKMYHDVRHGSFTCCGKEWHSARYMNAHHASVHAGRWSGKAARTAGRKMGKGVDEGRRWALGVLESARLREWVKVPVRDKDGNEVVRNGRAITREVPVRTGRDRSRPEVRGTVTPGQLRELHRHDRDHERADGHEEKAKGHHGRAGRHDERAKGHRDAGRTRLAARAEERAARHRGKAGDREAAATALRTPWTKRAEAARPAPARTDDAPLHELLGRAATQARAPQNGHAPRTPRAPGPQGRLAPAPPDRTPRTGRSTRS